MLCYSTLLFASYRRCYAVDRDIMWPDKGKDRWLELGSQQLEDNITLRARFILRARRAWGLRDRWVRKRDRLELREVLELLGLQKTRSRSQYRRLRQMRDK